MAQVTKLYLHECRYDECPARWSKYTNTDADGAALGEQTASDPIILRHTLKDSEWVTQSFTVQSPVMREQLRAALAAYQDYDPELEDWTFKPSYQPLVHRWTNLTQNCEATTDAAEKATFVELIEFLRGVIGNSIESLAKTRETGKVSFEKLWQIFNPGDLAVTRFYGVEVVCRMTKYERKQIPGRPPTYVVELEYLDWNGQACGLASTTVTVGYFKGYSHVTSLPIYPLSYSSKASAIRQRLIARGRKFEALRGYHFQSCQGTKVLLETKCPEARPVDGRVIVDAHAYYLSNNIVKPKLAPSAAATDKPRKAKLVSDDLVGRDDDVDKDSDDTKDSDDDGDDTQDSEDDETSQVPGGPEMATVVANQNTARVEDLRALTDDECLLATPWVKGLDLKTKEWAQFCVDDLTPVKWNEASFDRLVLPGNEKELSWEFVENKALADNGFDDFVQDKGRGIIILMFGPPGVGKTFTAEAVAERAHLPLYSISAGTLGTEPKEVEAALDRALELCQLWNAMLLLDEADVFLGTRSTADLTRNELVSVFLTKFEYYSGVCFLTTNRVSSIDPAFQSRVDLFLRYDDLLPPARKQVWENFMERVGRDRFRVTPDEVSRLAELKLNGREIKNLIKSAHLLTLKNRQMITYERLWALADNRISTLQGLE